MNVSSSALAGFLIIDKPTGCTSFDIIRSLRLITKIRKIGHTGTLDPFASGMLICCLGSYTRLASLIEAHDKTYHAVMKLGQKTDTGDPTGTIIATDNIIPDQQLLSGLPDRVLNLTELPVPVYSAVKINGKRAYKYARRDLEIILPIKSMRVFEFEIMDYQYPCLEYRCRVSKGTYIRSLSEWIAAQLGPVGHTQALKRTAIGKTSLSESSSLSDLTETNWRDKLMNPLDLFDVNKVITPDESDIALLLAGQSISIDDARNGDVLVMDKDSRIRSYGYISQGILKPRINLR